jgi:plasmid stabilization system protein ParE
VAHQVLITDLAKADLREITEYIAQDNPAAAERFAQKLLDDALFGAQPVSFRILDTAARSVLP